MISLKSQVVKYQNREIPVENTIFKSSGRVAYHRPSGQHMFLFHSYLICYFVIVSCINKVDFTDFMKGFLFCSYFWYAIRVSYFVFLCIIYLFFGSDYQRNRLPGKTYPQNVLSSGTLNYSLFMFFLLKTLLA